MSQLTEVTCPVCGERVHAPCDVKPGWGGDYWNPPEPDDVDWSLDDFEYECECRAQIESNGKQYNRTVQEYNHDRQARMRDILRRWARDFGMVTGFTKREAHIRSVVGMLAGIPVRVGKLGPDRRTMVENVNLFLEAYDEEIMRRAENSAYDYDPPEPDYYDDRY